MNFLPCGTETSVLLYDRPVTFSYLPWNVTPNSALNFIERCVSLEANICADGQISQLVCDLRLCCIPQRLSQVRIARHTYLVHTSHYIYRRTPLILSYRTPVGLPSGSFRFGETTTTYLQSVKQSFLVFRPF